MNYGMSNTVIARYFFGFRYVLHESKIAFGHSRTSSRMEKSVARVKVA
jgi:hypothetical protein